MYFCFMMSVYFGAVKGIKYGSLTGDLPTASAVVDLMRQQLVPLVNSHGQSILYQPYGIIDPSQVETLGQPHYTLHG